ncbi:MAG: hypothetical protein ACI4S2_05995 [Lachnospiraceae bacterium]
MEDRELYAYENFGLAKINYVAVRVLDGITAAKLFNKPRDDARDYFENFAAAYGLSVIDTEHNEDTGFAITVPGTETYLIEMLYDPRRGDVDIISDYFSTRTFYK